MGCSCRHVATHLTTCNTPSLTPSLPHLHTPSPYNLLTEQSLPPPYHPFILQHLLSPLPYSLTHSLTHTHTMNIFRRKSSLPPDKSPPPKLSTPTPQAFLHDSTHDVFVVFEHERRRTDLGWSYRNLEAGDPKRYGTVGGGWQSETFQDPEQMLAAGWKFKGKW